ncbi:winged helix-turn-helix transcriptional regulator [Planomonospora sp. ID67723]|uniref:MarR family winged helix-turn-helix transcriptional regulator n=1 Tax=Planomonospora sp. ID67723 TaxID=2738134 RepID=UPI0018C40E13|nr:MarR family winged helix-turn-helix transcriptional regulator [Planomonospora sp. ID67723]MBG0833258.1 winged helix-turn-helix transcriptional regulator [Planomonospora sp. ID67723]
MSDTGWLDEDEQQAWRAFLQLQGQLTARLNRQLQADSGLSLADYEVLVHLTEAPGGRLRPYELQRNLQWEQSRLSHHLTRMQRRDLVGREECAADGRGAFVVLSETGRRAIETAAPGHVDAVRRLFFDALTGDQVAAIRSLSTQVLDRLASLPR